MSRDGMRRTKQAADGDRSLVAIAVGNTTVQWGYFPEADFNTSVRGVPRPLVHQTLPSSHNHWDDLVTGLPVDRSLNGRWFMASVSQSPALAIQKWIAAKYPQSRLHLLANGDFPLKLRLENTHTVGADRLAAAVAVDQLRDIGRPAIVIDAGTAITVNALSAAGEFLGGAIFPGPAASGIALRKSTDQLPEILIRDTEIPPPLGKQTDAAITSGLYWGAVGAVRELADRIAGEAGFDAPQRFVTGGFGVALTRHLNEDESKEPVVFDPQLVLSGIAITARSLESD